MKMVGKVSIDLSHVIDMSGEFRIFGNFNSSGALTFEGVLRFSTRLRLSDLINAETIENVYFEGTSLKHFFYDLMNNLDVSYDPSSMTFYPFVFSPSYIGQITEPAIYGILQVDQYYKSVAESEINRELGKDASYNLSIVKDILAFYNHNASLVICRANSIIEDNIGEITGLSAQEIITKNLGVNLVEAAESEYSVEVEKLREQYAILRNLINFLSEKELTNKFESEYDALLSINKRLLRRLDEINLIDTERFYSLRSVFKISQEKMGILDLKQRVMDIQNDLFKELETQYSISENRRGDFINLVVFSLILLTTAGQALILLGKVIYSVILYFATFLFLGIYSIVFVHRRRPHNSK
ncbi:MAG: hypothetical protein QW812_02080, partial [Thermoplasmataceae archaeon]